MSKGRVIKNFFVNNAPLIFDIVAVLGYAATTYLAWTERPVADKKLDEAWAKKAKSDPDAEDLTVKEQLVAVAPVYAPAVIAFVGATGCIIFSHRMHLKRTSAALAAYEVADAARRSFEKHTTELVEDKVVEEIKSRCRKDEIADAPEPPDESYKDPKYGKIIFKEPYTGMYFESTPEDVKTAENQLNAILLREGEATLNDLFDFLGLDSCSLGSIMGWRSSCNHDLIDIGFDADIDRYTRPILVLKYDVYPIRDFRGY